MKNYMNVKIFVDTNIWVYAHLEAENDSKHQKANILVEETSQLLVISTPSFARILLSHVEK